MNDLISRAALFNSLANVKTLEEAFAVIQWMPAAERYTEGEVEKMQELEAAEIQKAYELGREEWKPRWIPCAERLPEKYIGEWLCCTDDGRILVLPYDTPGDGSKECVFYRWDDRGDMYETYNVIAWMPLPEPYKGEE